MRIMINYIIVSRHNGMKKSSVSALTIFPFERSISSWLKSSYCIQSQLGNMFW